jgi:hypothetical protein
MSNYLNGYNYPKFTIYDENNVLLETINLNLCNEGGLIETYEIIKIEHTLLDYSVTELYKGHHITFKLDYTNYTNKANTVNILKLVSHILDNHTIILTPRIDVLARHFEVYCNTPTYELGLLRGGSSASGHKLISLSFKTKELQTGAINYIDPDTVATPMDEQFITI